MVDEINQEMANDVLCPDAEPLIDLLDVSEIKQEFPLYQSDIKSEFVDVPTVKQEDPCTEWMFFPENSQVSDGNAGERYIKDDIDQKFETRATENSNSCLNIEAQKYNVPQYMPTVHTGEKSFKCTMCEYRCTTDGSLQAHLIIHAGIHTETPIKKRKTLTLETKHEIVKLFEGGLKASKIALKMDLAHTTVRTIIKDKERILTEVKNARPLNSSIIRKRHGLIAEMESLLKIWCDNQVSVRRCSVDQSVICKKAKTIFARLKDAAGNNAINVKFVASNGWFNRFKQRCNWHSTSGTGRVSNTEQASISKTAVAPLAEEDPLSDHQQQQALTVAKLSEGLALIEAGLKVLEDVDFNDERLRSTRLDIKRVIVGYYDILGEKKKSLLPNFHP